MTENDIKFNEWFNNKLKDGLVSLIDIAAEEDSLYIENVLQEIIEKAYIDETTDYILIDALNKLSKHVKNQEQLFSALKDAIGMAIANIRYM